MAAVAVQIRGTLYDLQAKTSRQVLLQGEASLLGLEIGGGPIIPPENGGGGGGGGGQPPHPAFPIWGGPGAGFPDKPGYPPVVGGGPIYPPNVPPGMQPPTPPQPGDPTTPVPPPAGSQGWPVGNIVPPPYVIINYPGVGPVTVAPPLGPHAVPAA